MRRGDASVAARLTDTSDRLSPDRVTLPGKPHPYSCSIGVVGFPSARHAGINGAPHFPRETDPSGFAAVLPHHMTRLT